MPATLYVAIRGNYTEFQKDMTRVRGIAKESCRELANQFNNAIDPKFFKKGLAELARALKDVNRIASTRGGFLSPAIADLKELASKAEVSSQTMQHLANRMAEVGRSEQLSKALKNIQKYAGLTDAELAKLQKKMGDTAGSMETAMNALGVRSTQKIKREIAALEAAFDHLAKHGKLSAEELERAFAGLEKKLTPLYAELGVLNKPAGRSKSLEVLGMKTDSEYRAEAKKIAQAYLDIKTSASSTAGDVVRAHARMIESYRRLREEMTAGQAKPQKPLYETDPGKVLGVRTYRQVADDISALQNAFINFSKIPGITAAEVERAKARMQAAIRELNREMGIVSTQDKRDGFLKLLGIRSIEQIEADKQALISAHRQIVDEFQRGIGGWTTQDVRNSLAARNAGLERLSREAGTWQEPARASALRQRYDKLVSQAGSAGTSYAQFSARDTAKNAVNAFQELHGRLPRPSEIRQIAQACGQSATQIRRMRDELDHSSNAFKALIGYAQVWLTFGAFEMAKGFVKTAMEIENVKVAFQAIYGSADMAEKKLEYVRKVSDQLGLSFLDTAEGAKKLFAAAQGTPVEGKANMVFKSFSDMSAALKLTGDETKGVFLAISQMISKGKVSAEELRQQLAERMPGAVNLFAKSIGVTTKQLDKMLQGGEVTLEHFLKFAEEVGKTYSAGARMAGHSLQAELNRLGNTWIDFQAKSTNTGQLAEGVRQLNEMLKASLEIIAKLAPHMNSLVKIAFAGWLSSSLIPGGKLNAILAGLATACSACIGPIKTFLASMTAAVVGAGSLTTAVKALGAAMWSMAKNPAFLALMATGAIALKVLTDDADDAKESFKKVTESMDEMRKKRLELEQADKASNFGSHDVVVGMDDQINKRIREFEEERNKLQEQFNNLLTYDHFRNERVATTPSQLTVQGMLGQLDQFKADLKKAIGDMDIDAMDVLGNRFWSSWKQVQQKLEDMKIDEGVKASIARGWAGFSQLIDATKTDLLKKLGELEKQGSGSLATLGISFAQTEKEAKKFAKAVGSSDLGKIADQMRGMESLKSIFGPVSMELGKVTDATVTYGKAAASYLEQMEKAPAELEAHKVALVAMGAAVVSNTVTADEFAAAQSKVEKEEQALRDETQNVSQKMIDFALAMGGTNDEFNLVMQLCANAGASFRALGVDVQGTIADIRDFQMAATTAIYATKAIAGGQSAKIQFHGAEAQRALRKGDEKGFYEAMERKVRAEAGDNPVQVNGSMMMGWQEQYKYGRMLIDMNEADKKGKKKSGGGGGKKGGRVDNTAEKYNSAFEGFRKEIAKLQGEVDKVTLDKKFADMDKQLVGSKHNIQALKKEYYEAFNVHSLHEFDKTMYQLVGNERALADIDIEEKLKAQQAQFDGMNAAAKELGLATVDYTEKMEAYRKALENNKEEQYLQKLIPIYEEIASKDEDKVKILELQNKLIGIQAEKMLGSFPPEVVERWREMQMLEHSRNPWDGIILGLKKYSMETESLAKTMSSAVGQAFDGMADAFVQFATTGKFSFKDMANSIIADLMRITVKSMILGPIANAIGGALGNLFNLGGGGGLMAAKGGIQAAASMPSVSIPALPSAFGNVFTGLRGYSNQIVTRPTLFAYGSQLTRFAKGGVMGESGPEAIMPLTRTASGHLGVRSAGGGDLSLSLTIVDKTQGGIGVQDTQASQNGLKLDVIVQQIDGKLAGLAASGKSKFVGAIEKTHRMPSKRGWA